MISSSGAPDRPLIGERWCSAPESSYCCAVGFATRAEASFNQISHTINGGELGKADRLENWAEARTVMLA